ncbi:hypothetical protein [Cohnella herbarum]|uniref:Uncharacterized protein n=1 Tax=Cohnella herbarum TaxID=2728023 RepID=A0A7Z2ZL77_9BACL|nr:hypothetical protein [Cohnella herbarum]QJD83946.1 hypothetical protein HH215_12650 [Cohnella herbarum]
MHEINHLANSANSHSRALSANTLTQQASVAQVAHSAAHLTELARDLHEEASRYRT